MVATVSAPPIFTRAALPHFSVVLSGLLIAACLVASNTVQAASAQNAPPTDTQNTSPWDVSVGASVVTTPEYEGASKAMVGVVPDLNIRYKTNGFGTFALGSKSKGLNWTAIETEAYSVGLGLGLNAVRTDKKKGSIFTPGSLRLKGMGEIKPAVELGVFGHVNVGIPLALTVLRGTGDGKADAKDGSIRGHGGTTVELSTSIPWQVTSDLGLFFSPQIVWADKKYQQAYFGVTSVQAGASGFKAYSPGPGIKSAALVVGAEYKISPNWSANGTVVFSQLLGNAAKSPLVQRKGQATLATGITYKF